MNEPIPSNNLQCSAMCDVLRERARQDAKWGVQNHSSFKWLTILTEELGEAAQEILEDDEPAKLRHELVQVAAVALAFIECLDKQQGKL